MTVSLAALRRYAISRSLRPAAGSGDAIRQLGFVQADPIRAPARAQDLTLRHRVAGYRAGDLEYDVGTLTVRRAGRTIHLGPVDMTVLRILMQHAPRPVSYQQLLHAVWPDRDIPLNTVRSHVYRLRKLIDRPFALPLIQTCHGTGYAITTVEAHGPAAAPAAAIG